MDCGGGGEGVVGEEVDSNGRGSGEETVAAAVAVEVVAVATRVIFGAYIM